MLFILGGYFSLLAIFHFTRLALGLDIVIVSAKKDYPIGTIESAVLILFSILIIYLLCKAKKSEKQEKIGGGNNKEE